MTRSILWILWMGAWLALAVGQTTSPGLQKRPAGDPDGQHVTVIQEGGKTVLPDDAFGLYRFSDHENAFGEGLQINEQFGEVSGYLTISEGKGNHGRYSSYFLTRVTGGNGHFAFVTRQVHGVSYSFDGRVQRGPAISPAEDGYYVLDGTLNILNEAGSITHSKKITLNLTARH